MPRPFVLAAVALALCAASTAHAWGDRERAALIGLVAGAALASASSSSQAAPAAYPPVITAPEAGWHRAPPRVVYEAPAPVYVERGYMERGYHSHGPRFRDDVADAYARGAAERLRRERERAERDAYWDGFYGR